MNLFLKAKHWQIFLLTVGLPFLVTIVMMMNIMANFFARVDQNRPPDPESFFAVFKFFPIMMIVFMGTLFGWMWSMAIGLQKMISPTIQMKTTMFKIFFFYPLVYILLFCLFFTFSFTSILHMPNGGEPSPILFVGFAVIFPLHLFGMFCMFYTIYFVAKTIKTVELQREVSFSDFIAEFFLVWFHFIGVWILQPKINKMVENYENGIPQGPASNSFN